MTKLKKWTKNTPSDFRQLFQKKVKNVKKFQKFQKFQKSQKFQIFRIFQKIPKKFQNYFKKWPNIWGIEKPVKNFQLSFYVIFIYFLLQFWLILKFLKHECFVYFFFLELKLRTIPNWYQIIWVRVTL